MLIFCFTSAAAFGATPANSDAFSAEPNQCVALYQGEFCQLRIRLHWQVSSQVCLYVGQEIAPLACWASSVQQGDITLRLQESMVIRLRDTEENVIGEQLLNYAWVHSKANTRRARWRLF